MKKLRIVLTLLGVLFGAAMLYSFTPAHHANKGRQSSAKKVRFTSTKFTVTSIVGTPTSTTITFFGTDITGKVEGTDFHCVNTGNCYVEVVGSYVDNGGGSFTITGYVLHSGTYTPGH